MEEGLGLLQLVLLFFVPMSIPEDELEIEIISVKKTYARGLIKKYYQGFTWKNRQP